MAGILAIVGMLVMGVGGLVSCIMLLIVAFKESVVWGLASFFVPFVIFYFVFTHWEDSKKGFLISVGGFAAMIAGAIIMTMGAALAPSA